LLNKNINSLLVYYTNKAVKHDVFRNLYLGRCYVITINQALLQYNASHIIVEGMININKMGSILCAMRAAFQYSLLILKIYNIRNVHYRFPAFTNNKYRDTAKINHAIMSSLDNYMVLHACHE